MLVALDRGLQVRQPFTGEAAGFVAAVEALTPSAGEGDSALSELVDQVENTCDGTPGAVCERGRARPRLRRERAPRPPGRDGGHRRARALSRAAPGPQARRLLLGRLPDAARLDRGVGRGRDLRPPIGHPGALVHAGGPVRGADRPARRGAGRLDRHAPRPARRGQPGAGVRVHGGRARAGERRGARPLPRADPARAQRHRCSRSRRRSVRAPQEILYSIADGTGGTASVNTNELARGMQAAAKDARGYYLLAYAPPGGAQGGALLPDRGEGRAPRPARFATAGATSG